MVFAASHREHLNAQELEDYGWLLIRFIWLDAALRLSKLAKVIGAEGVYEARGRYEDDMIRSASYLLDEMRCH